MKPQQKTLKFITIEGIDGAGKSTTISMIEEYLKQKGEKVLITREPGGTELGEKLREINKTVKMDPLTETLLLFTARSEHVISKIKPALEQDIWVICDRFTDSTVAYQSGGKGLPESVIRSLETLVQGDIKPSLTFILDLPLSVARKRLDSTGKEPDKYESEKDAFFQVVADAYKGIFKKDPGRCRIIDSSRTVEDTNEQIIESMDKFYKEYLKKNPEKRQMKLF